MKSKIKDLRSSTGMTQKAFAKRFGIPLSTLRKWEQGESSPPKYVVELIAGNLPASDENQITVSGKEGAVYYYDRSRHLVEDARANCIHITEDLELVKEQNLGLYLDELFDAFYEIQEKFNRDCRFDQQEDILWI
ncbi:MAG: helix-turn-helix domain-containing protein [Firmicutes bacterium]|nr:helix-turn-helix domain-containing protein [Bacillota bacterium]